MPVMAALTSRMTWLAGTSLLGMMFGFWTGSRWGLSVQARAERAAQESYIVELQRDVGQLRASSAQALADYAEATERLDGIAHILEKDHEKDRLLAEQQRISLAALLERHPLLRDQRAGGDILQHWNRSNAGHIDAASSATDSRAPEGGLPSSAGGG